MKWLNENLDENGVYAFEFVWKRSGSRHVIILENDGKSLIVYDPQSGKVFKGDKQIGYLESIAWNFEVKPKILRVDKSEPNLEIVNPVLKPKVKK